MTDLKITLCKSISYRILSLVSIFVVGYLVTGSLVVAGSIALIDQAWKTIMYFLHEQAWNKIGERV
jgi:uncharacterized membrane protein